MEVNDEAGCLNARGVLTFIASELAPTGFSANPNLSQNLHQMVHPATCASHRADTARA